MSETLVHYSQDKIDLMNVRFRGCKDSVKEIMDTLNGLSTKYWNTKVRGWFLRRTRYDRAGFNSCLGCWDRPVELMVKILYDEEPTVKEFLMRLLNTDFNVVAKYSTNPSIDGVSLGSSKFNELKYTLRTCDMFSKELLEKTLEVLKATDPVKGVYVSAE